MFCVLWSILAKMFPYTKNKSCTSSYNQEFKKLDISGFAFSNGLKFEDILKLESMKKMNLYVFELNVKVKDDLNVTPKLLPIFTSDSESEAIDLIWFQHHF